MSCAWCDGLRQTDLSSSPVSRYNQDNVRVLVTRDADLLALDAEGVSHSGIVYWAETRSLAQLIKDLDSLCFNPEKRLFYRKKKESLSNSLAKRRWSIVERPTAS